MVQYNSDRPVRAKQSKRFASESNRNKEHVKIGWISNKFTEFCKRTDLHGYKYIVMEDLSPFERKILVKSEFSILTSHDSMYNNLDSIIEAFSSHYFPNIDSLVIIFIRGCWVFAVIVSLVIAVYFVVTAYRWYARNPIVTVIESTQGAIWDVPFPAITICDLNVISRRAARHFVDNITYPVNVTADYTFDVIRFAPLLHSGLGINSKQREDLLTLQTVLEFNNVSTDDFFRRLSPSRSCSQLVQRCLWKNTIYRCDKLFKHVLTIVNLCCSFNYFAIEDAETDNPVENAGTPRRVASCGSQTALTVLLHSNPDDYYSAMAASQGFLVFVDDAYNFPDLDSPVRMVNPSTEVLIALSPERTYATPGIKSFSPEQRQCYYYNEVKFDMFRRYSFHNCMAVQRMELIRRSCMCVPYYFPHKGLSKFCDFTDIECLENIIKPTTDLSRYGNHGMTFHCLPECEHFDYPLEVALGALAPDLHHNALPFFNDVKLENRSILNVFFSDLVSTKYRRDVYLNWQNILAAFGGLLSLMLGFTLLSGFDFVLFFTFRMAYDNLTWLTAPPPKSTSINVKKNKVNTRKTNDRWKKDGWTTEAHRKSQDFFERDLKKW